MFFCVSQKKNLIDLPLKKIEHPKHNFFLSFVSDKAKRTVKILLSTAVLSLFCLANIFYLLARVYIFPHSRNAFVAS